MELKEWATLAISLVALSISVVVDWRQWRWRPQAEIFFKHIPNGDNKTLPNCSLLKESRKFGEPMLIGYIMNCGDGEAYLADLDFGGCVAALYELRRGNDWSLVGYGEAAKITHEPLKQFVVVWDLPHQGEQFVGVHWTEQPTRLHRCRYKRLPLQEIPKPVEHSRSRSRRYRLLESLKNAHAHAIYHNPPKDGYSQIIAEEWSQEARQV
ncbi:hypothetical protein OZX57_01425 [Bifidobacterium sp. ESL0682]|uniref:hypothetical protein n=1 Tax=Bifidobacterium sp. ESL0682 TaxID=2983212 RepID=UPI0023F99575|nr:hypothetical protein [Bifidobacterium sp. ESL0682]WEV42187.1 hypothetical protein OZX57_01425 [Bifidobacterium sp. ESL0682]